MKKDQIDRWLEANTALFSPPENYMTMTEIKLLIASGAAKALRNLRNIIKTEDQKYEEALAKFRMGFVK